MWKCISDTLHSKDSITKKQQTLLHVVMNCHIIHRKGTKSQGRNNELNQKKNHSFSCFLCVQMHLGLYCFAGGQPVTSLRLLYRARYLVLMVCGEDHPEMAMLDVSAHSGEAALHRYPAELFKPNTRMKYTSLYFKCVLYIDVI